MLEHRISKLTSCGLWLALASACDGTQLDLSGVQPSAESGAFDTAQATLSDAGLAGRGGQSRPTPLGAGADPIQLPPSVSMTPAGALYCGAELCQCNNGIDDDGDGNIDGFDVECTGGIDDDEATFATGIPGDNRDPKWQDCFFDGNSGAGDDGCRYPTECLTGDLPLDDAACGVTQACLDNCQPRTPNGCDCFGCCAVALPGGGEVNVTLSGTCSLDSIGDPEACEPCAPNPTCANECGECELCPGKTPADLPASCANEPPSEPEPPAPEEPTEPEEPPVFTCDGASACAEASDCGVGEFCSMGCCLVVLH